MSAAEKLGVPPPPVAENKLFNVGAPTVTLLVEAGSDERFWRTFVHRDCLVRAHHRGGRPGVLAMLSAPNDQGRMILACLDADLDRVTGTLSPRDDVFWTDAHDLETTLLTLPGLLEKLVRRVVGPARWRDELLTQLLQFVRPAATLRWLRAQKPDERVTALRLHKRDKDGDIKGRFDKWDALISAELTPDAEAFLKHVIHYNNAQKLLKQLPDLAAALGAGPDAPDAQLCNGHDLIGALRAWLQHRVPSKTADPATTHKLADDEALTEKLIDCCEHAHLTQTAMWRAMLAWQAAHPRYPLLGAAPPRG